MLKQQADVMVPDAGPIGRSHSLFPFSPFPADWAGKMIKRKKKNRCGATGTKKNRKKGWRQIANNEIPLFFQVLVIRGRRRAVSQAVIGMGIGRLPIFVNEEYMISYMYIECVHVAKNIANFSIAANNEWPFHTPKNSQRW